MIASYSYIPFVTDLLSKHTISYGTLILVVVMLMEMDNKFLMLETSSLSYDLIARGTYNHDLIVLKL